MLKLPSSCDFYWSEVILRQNYFDKTAILSLQGINFVDFLKHLAGGILVCALVAYVVLRYYSKIYFLVENNFQLIIITLNTPF